MWPGPPAASPGGRSGPGPCGGLRAVRVLFLRRAARPPGGDLVGPHREFREPRAAGRGRERAVHRLPPPSDDDAAGARGIVPRLERVPAATDVRPAPRVEI